MAAIKAQFPVLGHCQAWFRGACGGVTPAAPRQIGRAAVSVSCAAQGVFGVVSRRIDGADSPGRSFDAWDSAHLWRVGEGESGALGFLEAA